MSAPVIAPHSTRPQTIVHHAPALSHPLASAVASSRIAECVYKPRLTSTCPSIATPNTSSSLVPPSTRWKTAPSRPSPASSSFD